MALISFSSILSLLHTGDLFSRRSDAQYWGGWISGDGNDRKVKVTDVSLDEHGLDLEIVDGATTYRLQAVPTGISHSKVFLDDKEVEGAAMVFAPKPSIGNLTRYAFDFRPVTLNGNPARFNMRYDP